MLGRLHKMSVLAWMPPSTVPSRKTRIRQLADQRNTICDNIDSKKLRRLRISGRSRCACCRIESAASLITLIEIQPTFHALQFPFVKLQDMNPTEDGDESDDPRHRRRSFCRTAESSGGGPMRSNLPDPVINWAVSFKEDRRSQLRLGSFLGPARQVNVRIPQGSPIS